jgi:hypothetical protein
MRKVLTNEDVQFNKDRNVNRALRKNEAIDRLNRIERGEIDNDELYFADPRFTLNSKY